jgi:hypothetical protein
VGRPAPDGALGFWAALAEIWNAEDREHAEAAARSFVPLPPSAFGSGSPRGPDRGTAGVAMAFKLLESAQQRWRAVNAPHLVALVRAGARFENGLLVERPDESGGDQQVA